MLFPVLPLLSKIFSEYETVCSVLACFGFGEISRESDRLFYVKCKAIRAIIRSGAPRRETFFRKHYLSDAGSLGV